jgi:hypothetical protein
MGVVGRDLVGKDLIGSFPRVGAGRNDPAVVRPGREGLVGRNSRAGSSREIAGRRGGGDGGGPCSLTPLPTLPMMFNHACLAFCFAPSFFLHRV